MLRDLWKFRKGCGEDFGERVMNSIEYFLVVELEWYVEDVLRYNLVK